MAMSQTGEIAIHGRRSRQDNPNPMSAQRGARTGSRAVMAQTR
jgi:hypothetical protein